MPSGVYQHKKGYKRPPFSEEWKRNISIAKKKKPILYWLGKTRPGYMKGKKHSEQSKEKMRLAHLGKSTWSKGLKGIRAGEKSHLWKGGKPKCDCGKILSSYIAKECLECYKKSNPYKGEKNHNWKNGISKINKTERQLAMETLEYKLWRKTIFERDNWKCRITNKDCDGRIEAHHILGWSSYPELRYEINNGITLCHAHHPLKRAEEKRLAPIFQELVTVSN